MPTLEWDVLGARTYENGIDRAVLYLGDGTPIPWSGLTEVVRKNTQAATEVFYDGKSIGSSNYPGEYSATMKAITYPSEFEQFEGLAELQEGMLVGSQPSKTFNLTYRTRKSNDQDPDAGYVIHVVYNLTAIPSDKTFQTISDTQSVAEFEWTLSAIPEDVPGIRPTAELIFDSTRMRPDALAIVEAILYGSEDVFPGLIPMRNLLDALNDFYRFNPPPAPLIEIIDNGDGTWTAVTTDGTLIIDHGDGTFTINDATAIFAGDLYLLTDTP